MEQCPICLDDLTSSRLTRLECGTTLDPPSTSGHSFHAKCLNEWRHADPRRTKTCPVCRRPLGAEEFPQELVAQNADVVFLDLNAKRIACFAVFIISFFLLSSVGFWVNFRK